MKTTLHILGLLFAAVLIVSGGTANAIAPSAQEDHAKARSQSSLAPSPTTIDQITHNQGNIITTVDNHGYIGGYWPDLPSGEWPRNSGHDYIGEIKYWMGATYQHGDTTDTLVANTWDEFQGMPSLVSGVSENKILLSTDTTRYWNYDPTDTVGLGIGNPAYGWRVWDPITASYVYSENYDPILGDTVPGGPISLQESHFRFNDAAGGTPLLGLEVTHTMLQWNYCYNEDFIYVILEITNTSAIDYTNFAFGLYVDIDVGGPDGTGENGRLWDLVDYDVAENLAWTYDSKGVDPGWGPTVKTGVMGTKYLETPDGIGMTGLRTGAWSLVPDDDPGRFQALDAVGYDAPIAPEDQYYIQCTRGINLTAGKTVRVVYAIIAGQDEEEFRDNASLAQQLYDNHFVGPQPPPTPVLSARPSDGKVYLHWTDTSEVGIDPLSGEQDFAGYKLYRSDNQGKTWGLVNYQTGNSCLTIDYDPVAMYTISTPGQPIAHSFVDTGLYNGVEYWYCLAAFDRGDTVVGVDPLQSGFGIAGAAKNVVGVTPVTDPAGYYEAAATVDHDYSGDRAPSEGSVTPIIFDETKLTGDEYSVVFEDYPDQTYWHLINNTTGDTVLVNQTRYDGEAGLYEIGEGLRVVVTDGERVPSSMTQTAIGGSEATLEVLPGDFYGTILEYFYAVAFGNAHTRSTYELRYTGDSTVAPAFNDNAGMGTAWRVPFEIWNTTTNQRVSAAVYDIGLDGTWDPWDLIIIVNYPYNPAEDPFTTAWPYYFSWMFRFDDTLYNPSIGDVFTIGGAPQNGPEDVFTFKVDGISAVQASVDMNKIRVVPDPYFVKYSSMVETDPGESVIEFQNVPDKCTIRIYTLAGDLVQTIEHDNPAEPARWNLLSSNVQQVASGIYIYHVDSPYGQHLGRFAVIK